MLLEDKKPIKEFRDPIHGFIPIYEEELAIVNSPIFQRLRSIKQLSFAYLVYHGAEHSRFGHVLGTMHIVSKGLEKIKKNSESIGINLEVTADDFKLARFAALLHDIGHQPFSHALDKTIPDAHEKYSSAIVKNVFASVIEKAKVNPNDVVNLIEGKSPFKKPFLSSLINGQLDVDKFDYLLRDSLYAGVKYGIFDLDRLLDSLAVVDEELVVLEKGYYAAEQLIIARYHMFEQLYQHRTKRAFENMARKIGKYLRDNDRLNYPSVKQLNDPSQLEFFAHCNDAWFSNKMKNSQDEQMSNLANLIEDRNPFKVVVDSGNIWKKMAMEKSHDAGIGYTNAMWDDINHTLVGKGINESEISLDEVRNIPYKLRPYTRLQDDQEEPDVVSIYNEKIGTEKRIEEVSPIVKTLATNPPRSTRIYVDRRKYELLHQFLRNKFSRYV